MKHIRVPIELRAISDRAKTRAHGKPAAGTPAVQALQRLNVAYSLHSYPFGSAVAIALEAAQALEVVPARVLKTLMATVDDRLVAALVPADRELNLKALATALGGKRAAMADLRQAERATGYVKGGISPFGQRQRSPAVVDDAVLAHASVFINGGRRGLEIELAPNDLIAALDARAAPIAR